MNQLKVISIAIISLIASAVYAGETIKIGVAGPHTGQYAAFGQQLWKGAEKAADHINAKGGINGKKIILVKGDDACEPKQAVAVARRMVDQDEVTAVVGHFCSSSSIPASDIYAEAGILMITPASTNPQFTERGLPNVFRMCGRDDQQGDVAGQWIVDNLKPKNVAIIHDKATYGQGLADATKAKLNNLGITEVLYEGLTRGEKDFNALVTKIKSVNADMVYFGGLHNEAAVLVKQMREQGLNIPFISGDGIVSQDFVNALGSVDLTKNVFMTFGKDPRGLEAGKEVVAEFKGEGYEPEGYTLYSYSVMQSIAKALQASDLDGEKAATYLKSNEISTAMGKKSWTSKGDLKVSDYVMYEWKGKDYKEVK